MAKEAYEIKEGKVIDYTITKDTEVGEVVALGNMIGIAMVSGVAGETIGLSIEGVYSIKAKASEAIVVGDELFFDKSNRELTITATDNSRAGIAVSTKSASAIGSVEVKLNIG